MVSRTPYGHLHISYSSGTVQLRPVLHHSHQDLNTARMCLRKEGLCERERERGRGKGSILPWRTQWKRPLAAEVE